MEEVKVTAKVAFQESGILFELTETRSVSDSLTKEKIEEIKTQMLTDNLITLNNYHSKIKEK